MMSRWVAALRNHDDLGPRLRYLLGLAPALAALGLAAAVAAYVYVLGANVSSSDSTVILPVGGAPGIGGPSAGVAAPNFTITTFDGRQLSLADLKGQAVVLNFWASWCPPCRIEMPYFETTYRTYRERDVVFVGVATRDRPEDSRAFLEELGITYPNGSDEGREISTRYNLIGLPTTVFITRDGTISRQLTGALSEKQLVRFVEEIAK